MTKSEHTSGLSLVFPQLPGKCLLLLPDSPRFSIVASTAAFAEMARFGDRNMAGVPVMEAFPDTTVGPEEEHQRLLASLNKVVASKSEDVLPVQRYEVVSGAGLSTLRSWRTTNKPILSEDGEVMYIVHQVEEITDELHFSRIQQAHDQRIISVIEGSTFPIAIYLGREMKIAFSNQAIRDVWGKGNDVHGETYYSLLPELEAQNVYPTLDAVYVDGIPFHAKNQKIDLMVDGAMREFYFNYSFMPLRDASGNVYGVINTASDVTDLVLATKELEQSEAKFRAIIEQAPVATCLFTGPDMVIEMANELIIDMWGKGPGVIGKPLLEALPELAGQPFPGILSEIYRTGMAHQEAEAPADLVVNGKLKTSYFSYTYKPIIDKNGAIEGILDMAVDVSGQVLSRKALEESKDQLHFAIEATELGTFDLNSKTGKFTSNTRLKSWFGLPETEEIDLQDAIAAIAPKDRERVSELIQKALEPESGGRYETQYTIINAQSGEERIVLAKGKASFDETGTGYRLNGTLQDITSQAISNAELSEKQQTLEMALEVAQLGLFNYDLESGMVINSQLVLDWFGLDESLLSFHDIAQYILFDDRASVEETFAQTIAGHNGGRHDIVYRIINQDNGELRYMRSIGQVVKIDGAAVAVSGIKQDVTESVLAQQKIEEIVRERTQELAESNKDLEKSNAELAQFAYIASHDLQEPLRKVSMFTQMLEASVENLPDRARNYLEKIKSSSLRMTALIRDVLTYSQLSGDDVAFRDVDLNEVLHATLTDFELLIEQTGAVVETENLPVIPAIPLQMSQLFNNLISNSLKYRRPDVSPRITITTSVVSRTLETETKAFHEIIFSDNGIGFSPEYAEQIFNIFQRLHRKSDYEGTGIGLAICRKIAENHNGELTAEGSSENGAVFHFRVPVAE